MEENRYLEKRIVALEVKNSLLRKKVTILKNALDSSNQSLKEMEIANDNLKHLLRLAEDEVRR